MRIAYFDCFSGISGDMAVAAFLDAGLSIDQLSGDLKKLKIKGYRITSRRVKRGEIAGTKFDCISQGPGSSHRPLSEIMAIINKSSLNGKAKSVASEIFANIGNSEAKIHGISSKRDILLHELGHIDSIVDIVSVAIAIDRLGIDEIYSSSINLGRTFVNSQHGRLPIPAPAALELLKGAPTKISDEITSEVVTPTGAGILKTLCKGFGEMPRMNISKIGYGAGSADPKDTPNMLRVVIGETADSFKQDSVMVIEANIDDLNPQIFEHLFDRLLKEGALDCFTTAIQMKKTRPAFKLTVLADAINLNKIADIIFRETTTIGVRFYRADRLKLDRKIVKVTTKYGPVKVKISIGPNGISTASPEYEECAKLARSKKVPLRAICEEAKAVASNY